MSRRSRELGNLYPRTLTFPIDFNPIGLDYLLTLERFDTFNSTLRELQRGCQAAKADTIYSRQVGDPLKNKQELIPGGELHLGSGKKYTVYKPLASGAFGTTAIVKDNEDGRPYCLKRQTVNSNDSEIKCFKEAMMHHILDVDTRPDGFTESRSNLIPRLYHIVRSAREEIYIYFIMDLMSDSLHNIIYKIPSYHGRLIEFVRCIFEIRPTLELLYAKGSYTHGDLHMGNVMYDAISQSHKIIDYGFSRITIKDSRSQKSRTLALDELNNRSDESRDLTQLITAFELSYKINNLDFTEGSFEHAVQQLIQTVSFNATCPGLGRHPEHTYNLVKGGWGSTYEYLNAHTNVNGTYQAINKLLNELPRFNAPPSAVSHRPVSVAASAYASAAPRTPRVGRVPMHELRTEEIIGQMNLLGPGCMLFYLMMMMIALVFGSKMYYGKGGREPNMNALIHSNLSHQVIPFKNTVSINPRISFQPNYSIKMMSKNLSNRKNNSKTRSKSVSKRNTTRRHSYKVIKTTIEDFNKLSIVSFYHFLRFNAFPDVSQKEKKEMLREAAMVPLQRPDVFSQIVEAVKNNDIDQMMEILQKNKIDVSKLGLDIQPYQELWNTILDAYFEEKDSPFELLQTLLHVGDQVDDFLKRYHSADKETKKMMVMQTCITASDAPELMLE